VSGVTHYFTAGVLSTALMKHPRPGPILLMQF
jgi:hypothetical protein